MGKQSSPPPEKKTDALGIEKERYWEDVGFIVLLVPVQGGQTLVVGRAAGIRSDGPSFIADYLFPTGEYPADLMWQTEAQNRLQTFLHCECQPGSICFSHRYNIPQWKKMDFERIQLMNSKPLSKAIEVMILAERAAAPKKSNEIVLPG